MEESANRIRKVVSGAYITGSTGTYMMCNTRTRVQALGLEAALIHVLVYKYFVFKTASCIWRGPYATHVLV